MKNNKGFTIIELLVSITLSFVVLGLLFETIILLKNLYTDVGANFELTNKRNLISDKINSDFINEDLDSISSCQNASSNCALFYFDDGSNLKLNINKSDRIIEYGDYKIELPEYVDLGDITIKVDDNTINLNSRFTISYIDSLYIRIPILNNIDGKDYGINILY